MRWRRPREPGSAAAEFALLAVPFMLIIFGMADLAHYVVVQQSLNTLTSEVARTILITCGPTSSKPGQIPYACARSNPLSTDQQRQIAPMLFLGSAHPQFAFSQGNPVVITGTMSELPTLLPWWGDLLGGLVSQTSVQTY